MTDEERMREWKRILGIREAKDDLYPDDPTPQPRSPVPHDDPHYGQGIRHISTMQKPS